MRLCSKVGRFSREINQQRKKEKRNKEEKESGKDNESLAMQWWYQQQIRDVLKWAIAREICER